MMRILLAFVCFSAMFSAAGATDKPAGDIWPITDYAITGTGPTKILIIPCMACRWRAFDMFMERNASKYTMYAVTIPGFGGTPQPRLPLWSENPVWHENAVAALNQFIAEHGIEDAIVVSHSWGARLAAELLAENRSFAKGWIILDMFVPINSVDDGLSSEERLALVDDWRESYMEPLRDPDEWAKFNAPAPYMSHDRQLLYHGMFMATPRDVVFQYWRENGLKNINENFAAIGIPVLDVKSIPNRTEDVAAYKKNYRARYDTLPPPKSLKTIFIEKSGHHIVEQRPAIVDEIVEEFIKGVPLSDYAPQE